MQKRGLPANMKNGMISALFIWAGFVMTSLIVNHQFQMQKRALTLIDGGHWLGRLPDSGRDPRCSGHRLTGPTRSSGAGPKNRQDTTEDRPRTLCRARKAASSSTCDH